MFKSEVPLGDLGPTPLDLQGIRAGDKNEMILNLTVFGDPLDLSDVVLEAQARANKSDTGDAPIHATITVIDDPLDGRVSACWDGDEVRAALGSSDVWNGFWDLQATIGADKPITLMEGTFEARLDVTR